MILFTVIPTILDMFLALAVFVYYFDWMLTSVIFAVMVAYGTSSFCYLRIVF
jgi:ABC-type transport system involved in Fe-S cluster assembly fused permease/ATPase subunit